MGDWYLYWYVFYYECISLTISSGIKVCGLEEQAHLSTGAAGDETEEARSGIKLRSCVQKPLLRTNEDSTSLPGNAGWGLHGNLRSTAKVGINDSPCPRGRVMCQALS